MKSRLTAELIRVSVMGIILFGCKDTTLHVMKWAKKRGLLIHLITLTPDKAAEQKVAGYEDLSVYTNLFSSIHLVDRYDLKSSIDIEYISSLNCNVGLCMGWQRLIPRSVLDRIPFGVYGMHGSSQNLPYGKGRSPMNWSIIEGRSWFFTNLFSYRAGVDDGPILDTSCFSIQEADTAETLHFKNTTAFLKLLDSNLDKILSNKVLLREQEKGVDSFYPKREPENSQIDWYDSIHNIDRLIKAVSKPFNGAFSHYGTCKVTIFRASIFYVDLEDHYYKDSKIGAVCDVYPNGKFLVKCNGGVIIVHEFESEFEISESLVLKSEKQCKAFARNRYGFFDI